MEGRVAALEAVIGATPDANLAATPVSAPGFLSFAGSGQTAVDPFDLPGGLYKFSVTCDNGFLNVEMKPVAGDEYVSVGLLGGAPYTGSNNVSVDGGRYALAVTCGGNWTVVTEPVR